MRSTLRNGTRKAALRNEIFAAEESIRDAPGIEFLRFAGVHISLDTSCILIASGRTGRVEPIDKWDGDGKYAPRHRTKSKY